MSAKSLFVAKGITKSFPGVRALSGVDFRVDAGEIHALLGVNGAGKSTLVKIISGVYAPDSGQMLLDGEPFRPRNVAEAIERGIAIVYQERTLIPYLTVAENVLLGYEPTHLSMLNDSKLRASARELIERLGVRLDLDREVRRLGEGERQLVDILRILRGNPKIIILDEPTAALTQTETERLFSVLRRFREQGMGIVFVSHRLDEVFSITDRITVLRDGKVVNTTRTNAITKRDLSRLMVNREIALHNPSERKVSTDNILLDIRNLSGAGFVECSLKVRRGEVVGMAGAIGAGRTEVLETIAGVRRPEGGKILLRGKEVALRTPEQAVINGIALVPEKRAEKGIIERLSVRDNLALPSLRQFSRFGVVLSRKESQSVSRIIERLGIVTPGIESQVRNLSGGNQQKVVIGKWLLAFQDVRDMIFLFDEPTEGVDVGIKAEMWSIIRDLAGRGAGVIVVSSELEEIMYLSDRIYVMREGKIVKHTRTSETTQEELLHSMLATIEAGSAI